MGFLNFVSAGIYFSEVNSKYNFGDLVEINVQVDPVLEGYLLKVDLICQGNKVINFNNLPDESGNVNIKLPLNFFTIDETQGECYFSGTYGPDTRESMKFEISRKLNVRLNADSFFANPGEEILISGKAERLNRKVINGEVEITIPLLNLEDIETVETNEDSVDSNNTAENADADNETAEESEEVPETVIFDAGKFYGKVTSGDFSVNIILPENSPAGDYRIETLVYEESSGKRSGEGTALANLKVFQVLKGIDISLNDQNFDPGETFEFKPFLLDQTGQNVDEEVSVIIRNSELERVYEKIVKSQEVINYQLPTNLEAGNYEIIASGGGFESIKKIYVNEKAIVSFEIINSTLVVTNIGNIPYNKDIEVELNGKSFVKKVELALGESEKFKLSGPEGAYNIKVSDGNSEITQGGVMLTGRFVDVDTISGKTGISKFALWIIVIVILGGILFFLFRVVYQKKSFAFHSDAKKDIVEIKKEGVIGPQNQADQVLVLKGNKNAAVVLVLKIKNKIGKLEKTTLEKSMEYVYQKKGAVYEQGDFIFIIFSSLMTKTNKNEILAAKSAENIINIFGEHNKKFRDKIDFGIGINSGEIINKIDEGKLKFTALGNFIVAAKRLADASDKNIFVTNEFYQRGGSEIKAEKKKIASGEVYEIRRVIDQEKNQEFIKGFVNRMRKDEGHKDLGKDVR